MSRVIRNVCVTSADPAVLGMPGLGPVSGLSSVLHLRGCQKEQTVCACSESGFFSENF